MILLLSLVAWPAGQHTTTRLWSHITRRTGPPAPVPRHSAPRHTHPNAARSGSHARESFARIRRACNTAWGSATLHPRPTYLLRNGDRSTPDTGCASLDRGEAIAH